MNYIKKGKIFCQGQGVGSQMWYGWYSGQLSDLLKLKNERVPIILTGMTGGGSIVDGHVSGGSLVGIIGGTNGQKMLIPEKVVILWDWIKHHVDPHKLIPINDQDTIDSIKIDHYEYIYIDQRGYVRDHIASAYNSVRLSSLREIVANY